MQILLNDPARIGGRSDLDLNADIGIIGPNNASRLALWAADLNQMLREIYIMLGYRVGFPTPFSTTVPLNNAWNMPTQSVTGPLTFTAGANPVSSGGCIVRLVADGVHIPNLNAFTLTGVSGSYVNTAGAVNLLNFLYLGSQYLVTVVQEGASSGVGYIRPSIAGLTLMHGTNPQLVIAIGGANPLNTAAVPPVSAFSLASTQNCTITGVSVSATSITLQLAGNVALTDTLALSYTPPNLATPIAGHSGIPQDTSGNHLEQFTAAAVTVS